MDQTSPPSKSASVPDSSVGHSATDEKPHFTDVLLPPWALRDLPPAAPQFLPISKTACGILWEARSDRLAGPALTPSLAPAEAPAQGPGMKIRPSSQGLPEADFIPPSQCQPCPRRWVELPCGPLMVTHRAEMSHVTPRGDSMPLLQHVPR